MASRAARRAEQKRQEKAQRSTTAPIANNRPHLSATYSSPAELVAVGPLMPAIWEVPPDHAAALRAASRPVPDPIDGWMLVDTGASHTCISLDTALALGLKQVGVGETYGAGGLHQNRVFGARFLIAYDRGDGETAVMGTDRAVMGIPDLGKSIEPLLAASSSGRQLPVVGLLGRDFLRHVTLTYDGDKGKVEIFVNHDSFRAS